MNDQIITAIKDWFEGGIMDGYVDEDIHLPTGNIILILNFDYQRSRSDFLGSPTTNLNASIWEGDNRRDCTRDELTIIKDTLNAI